MPRQYRHRNSLPIKTLVRSRNRAGLRRDGRALDRLNVQIGSGSALVLALEQHAPIKGTRSHERKALEHLFSDLRIRREHKPHRLDQAWKQSGLAERLLQEHLAVERAVLRANIGETDVSIEVTAGDPA